jgi:hypothetical protein
VTMIYEVVYLHGEAERRTMKVSANDVEEAIKKVRKLSQGAAGSIVSATILLERVYTR